MGDRIPRYDPPVAALPPMRPGDGDEGPILDLARDRDVCANCRDPRGWHRVDQFAGGTKCSGCSCTNFELRAAESGNCDGCGHWQARHANRSGFCIEQGCACRRFEPMPDLPTLTEQNAAADPTWRWRHWSSSARRQDLPPVYEDLVELLLEATDPQRDGLAPSDRLRGLRERLLRWLRV